MNFTPSRLKGMLEEIERVWAIAENEGMANGFEETDPLLEDVRLLFHDAITGAGRQQIVDGSQP